MYFAIIAFMFSKKFHHIGNGSGPVKQSRFYTPEKWIWNPKIIQLKGKVIFQTSILGFHVHFPGYQHFVSRCFRLLWMLVDDSPNFGAQKGRFFFWITELSCPAAILETSDSWWNMLLFLGTEKKHMLSTLRKHCHYIWQQIVQQCEVNWLHFLQLDWGWVSSSVCWRSWGRNTAFKVVNESASWSHTHQHAKTVGWWGGGT